MPGHKDVVHLFLETSRFDDESNINSSSIDHHICHNRMSDSLSTSFPGNSLVSLSNSSVTYVNNVNHKEGGFHGWYRGESSSLNGRVQLINGQIHSLDKCVGTSSELEDEQLKNVNNNLTDNKNPQQNFNSNVVSHGINLSEGCVVRSVEEASQNDVTDKPDDGSRSKENQPVPLSTDDLINDSDDERGSLPDIMQLTGKRKSVEVSGESSTTVSSYSPSHDNEPRLIAPHNPISPGSAVIPSVMNPEGVFLNARHEHRVGEVAASNTQQTLNSLTNLENSYRNIRMRTSIQQEPGPPGLFSSGYGPRTGVWIPQIPYSMPLSLNHPLPQIIDATHVTQSYVPQSSNLPLVCPSSIWNVSMPRVVGLTSSFIGENLRSVSRNLSPQPMVMPSTSLRAPSVLSSQWNSMNWNSHNIGIMGVSQLNDSGLINRHSHFVDNQTQAFPEVRQESQFPSLNSELRHLNNNWPPLPNNTSQQGTTFSSEATSQYSRSDALMERHHPHAVGIPIGLRSRSAGGGRRMLTPELRYALDLFRRGENLRLQLEPPDIDDGDDRHRDMRLDVDNMSYEELLELGEHIGNVNTGLSEETILKYMKCRKHSLRKKESSENESCCVCQEEYDEGQELGVLDCGHDFHTECIKQWLMFKKICPICKKTALNT